MSNSRFQESAGGEDSGLELAQASRACRFKKNPRHQGAGRNLEARVGIEPAYAALQAAA
jgi:hypothetical protein